MPIEPIPFSPPWTRRRFLRCLGAGSTVLSGVTVLAACGGSTGDAVRPLTASAPTSASTPAPVSCITCTPLSCAGPTPSSAAAALATTVPALGTDSQGPGHGGGFGNLGPRADGTVTAINGDTVTIKADSDVGQSGEYAKVTTVTLSSSTVYNAGHDSTTAGSKASVKVGAYIVAQGTVSSDGASLAATHVMVMDHAAGQFGPPGAGTGTTPGA